MSGSRSFLSQLNVFNKDNYEISTDSKTLDTDANPTGTSDDNRSVETGEHFDVELDKGSKKLGLISCIGLICNRMLGTGIFAVSSTIYTLSGSVGLALILSLIHI